MIKEYLVLGEGLKKLDDGFTEAEHKTIKAKKEKMKMFYNGRTYVGRCSICKVPIREEERFFYLENKNGLGDIRVEVEHYWHS